MFHPVAEDTTDQLEVWGYGLWVVGIVLFVVASARSGDWLSFAGSVLFLVGIVVVMVPMVRRHRS